MKAMLKAALLALFSFALIGGVPRLTQAQSTSSNVPEPAPKKSTKPPKVETMGGHLNNDGTIFVADKDLKSWKIANPDAVKNYKSENVTIDALEDPLSSTVTVKTIREKNEKYSPSK